VKGGRSRASHSEFLIRAMVLMAVGAAWLATGASPALAAKRPLHISAAHTSIAGEEQLSLSGNVTISDEDFSVQGEELQLDLKNNVAQFIGDVTLKLRDQTLTGKDLWLNLDTREWRFHNSKTELQPSFFGKGVAAPVILSGEEVEGTSKEVRIAQGGFTTCNLAHPHYHIGAGNVLIIVGDKLTAHQVSLFGGRYRLVRLPVFSLPLRPIRRPPYLPEMGRNRVEGAFVKFNYPYTASEKTTGNLNVALTGRQGLDTAVQYKYTLTQANGEINLDRQWKRDALNGSLLHHQTIGPGLNLDSSANYVRNSYYSAGLATNTNTNNILAYGSGNTSTSLSVNTSDSRGTFTSSNLSASLQHSQSMGRRLSASLTANFQNNTVPGGFHDQELLSHVELSGLAPNFNWRLTQEKRDDLDGNSYTGDSNYSYIQKLPELVLQTSTDKLPWHLLGRARGDLQMLLSRTTDRTTGKELFRSSFNMRSSGLDIPLSPSSNLNLASGFKQSFYEGGSAQYVLNSNARWRNGLGGGWKSNLQYTFQKAAGYSPFDYEQVFPQSSLNLDVSLDKPSARVSISSAYDLQRATYQDALLRANFQFSPKTALSLSSAYGMEDARLRTVTARYSRQGEPGRFSFDSSLRYEPRLGKISTVRSQLDWPISSQWRLEAVSGYNGIRKRLDYNDLRLTRDLHCFVASLAYSQQRKEMRFNFMIKAFPILDRYFGVGASGQQLGTGMGAIY